MKKQDVLIIGGGFAGVSAAYSLSLRGISSLIIERGKHLGFEASGNPRALLTPFVPAASIERREFFEDAWQLIRHRIDDLISDGASFDWIKHGALQLPSQSRITDVIEGRVNMPLKLATPVSKLEASEIAGIEIGYPTLWHEDAGSLDPQSYLNEIVRIASEFIEVELNCFVREISFEENQWKLATDKQSFTADSLVIANAYMAKELAYSSQLPFKTIRGEITSIAATSSTASLKTAICYGGYLMPLINGEHIIGASYDHERKDLEPDRKVQENLITEAESWLPTLKRDAHKPLSGRASFRTVSFDRTPYIGSLEAPGLYVSLAHGSRGLLTASLGGELLSEMIAGPQVKAPSYLEMLNPVRAIALGASQK